MSSGERLNDKTIGKIVAELREKQPDNADPIELQQASEQEYIDNLIYCVNKHKSKWPGDFYVVVEAKKEKLFADHIPIRCYFIARLSCPTPFHDQTVFKYHRRDEALEFLWTVPDKDACAYLRTNALEIPSEQRELLEMVLSYYDGSLLALCKKLNDEHDNKAPVILEIKETV